MQNCPFLKNESCRTTAIDGNTNDQRIDHRRIIEGLRETEPGLFRDHTKDWIDIDPR